MFRLFTFGSHYFSLSTLSSKTLEIDFPVFKHLITLSMLLNFDLQTHWNVSIHL